MQVHKADGRGGDLRLSDCKWVEMCHDWNEHRKGPYQTKDNGSLKRV